MIDEMVSLYQSGKSPREIGQAFHLSDTTVRDRLKRAGVYRGSKSGSKGALHQRIHVDEWTAPECAYLAGLLDGEGTIRVHGMSHRGAPSLTVYNTNKSILEFVERLFLRPIKWHATYRRPCGVVQLLGLRDCLAALEAVLPYLTGKRLQAIALMQYCKRRLDRLSDPQRGLTQDETALIAIINTCNARWKGPINPHFRATPGGVALIDLSGAVAQVFR